MRNDETTETNNQVQVKTVKEATTSKESRVSAVNWYRMYAEQSLYSNKANLNKTKSSMIWGSQWNQVMIWMKDVPSKEEYRGGTSENAKVKNIYDMAGNVYCWNLESCNTINRTVRGGSFHINDNSIARAVFRASYDTCACLNTFGSRLSLYVK